MSHRWYSKNGEKFDRFLQMRYGRTAREFSRLALKNTRPKKYYRMGKDKLGLYILPVDGSIPMEVHHDEIQVTHFMGKARVLLREPNSNETHVINADAGSQVVIPPGAHHEIENATNGDLYLWSVYISLPMAGGRFLASGQLFNVMSITKGAIGLCYHAARIPRDRALPGLRGVTVGQALQNTTGFCDDTWDYDAFRAVVDAPKGDLLAFALNRLAKAKRKQPGRFRYNNLMWQVLASSFKALAGRTLLETLETLIGRDGWTWDVTDGQPTGPSGLWMTRDAAERLGQAALDLPRPQPMPKDVFTHLEAGFDGYINGWFARGREALIAVGWRVQFIVAKRNGEVRVHLVEDDFTGGRSDEEWGFVHKTLDA